MYKSQLLGQNQKCNAILKGMIFLQEKIDKLKKKSITVTALSLCIVAALTATALRSMKKGLDSIPQTTALATTEFVYTLPNLTTAFNVENKLTGIPDLRLETTTEDYIEIPGNSKEVEAETTEPLAAPTYFALPLTSTIGEDYSMGEPVFSSTMGDWRPHNGVDFEGAIGDPVKASADGFVLNVTDDPLWGTVVEIDHGGNIIAKYCGLGRGSTLEVGCEVKLNDTIGYLGEVPAESDMPTHLHFELTRDGEYCDPLEILGKY